MRPHLMLVVLLSALAENVWGQPQPVLEIHADAHGQPVILISGEAGAAYVIESRSDLGDAPWLTRGVVELSDGGSQWSERLPADGGQRYYRAVQARKPEIQTIPNLVWIPPGSFVMGSPEGERGRWGDEGPQTRVTLTQGFWLGKFEVTQGDYLALMGNNPAMVSGDGNLDRPVENVTWFEATNYCARLTAREREAGRLPTTYAYRLPTEAQWEHACRAGTSTRFSFGDALDCADGCDFCLLASPYLYWCGTYGLSHPVGQRLPNPWGLHDMHGNVNEWCLNCYFTYPGGNVVDLLGPETGWCRVYRGGGHSDLSRYCRSAYRCYSWPEFRNYDVGFRVALVAVP